MLKLIKKSLIILLLLFINIIVLLFKSIYNFYEKNKTKIKKYAKNFHIALKEELTKWGYKIWEINITMMN